MIACIPSSPYALQAAQVFTRQGIVTDAYVHVSDGYIDSVSDRLKPGYILVDLGEYKLLPGLIDMHIHGRSGADVMDGTPQALAIMARELVKTGVVGFLGTTVTAPWPTILAALGNIRQTMASGIAAGAELLGAYVEGPFFTPTHKGAHPEHLFLTPTEERIAELLEVAGDSLKVVALAPETAGAVEATRQLVANGVQVAMGHTDATWEQVEACIAAGAAIGVHLHNGMRGLHHREPGCVGAMLANDDVSTEMIADGVHVHPAVLRLSWRCKGTDKSLLISDCMRAGGLADGCYQLGELPVTVVNAVARTECGSLAGSTLSLNQAIRNMTQLAGIPELDAVKMASEVPARVLGVDQRLGAIAPGMAASLTVMDKDFNVLLTLINGQPAFSVLTENNS